MSAFTVNTSIEGNLATDVTLRETGNGLAVANMRVAVTSRTRASNGEIRETSEFVPVVLWRDLAVNGAASLTKGVRVNITGNMKQRSYTNKDGNTVYIQELHADTLAICLRWAVVAPGAITKAKDAFAQSDDVPADDELVNA